MYQLSALVRCVGPAVRCGAPTKLAAIPTSTFIRLRSTSEADKEKLNKDEQETGNQAAEKAQKSQQSGEEAHLSANKTADETSRSHHGVNVEEKLQEKNSNGKGTDIRRRE